MEGASSTFCQKLFHDGFFSELSRTNDFGALLFLDNKLHFFFLFLITFINNNTKKEKLVREQLFTATETNLLC